MKWLKGNTVVARGTYFNMKAWEFVQIDAETPTLPGGPETKYIKCPTALALLTGPVGGLFFVIFLPTIGIVGLLGFLAYKLGQAVARVTRRVFQPAAVNWEPGVAHLVKRGGAPDAKAEDELDKLESTIEQKKAQGKK